MTSRQKAAIARRLGIVRANLRAGLAPDDVSGESLDAKAADVELPAATADLRDTDGQQYGPIIHDGPTFEEFLFGDHRSIDPDPRLSSIIPKSVRWSRLDRLSAAMDTAAAARSQYHGIRGLPGGNNGGVDGSAGR